MTAPFKGNRIIGFHQIKSLNSKKHTSILFIAHTKLCIFTELLPWSQLFLQRTEIFSSECVKLNLLSETSQPNKPPIPILRQFLHGTISSAEKDHLNFLTLYLNPATPGCCFPPRMCYKPKNIPHKGPKHQNTSHFYIPGEW